MTMENKIYAYGEDNNVNLKLVIAIHRTLQKDEKTLNEQLSKYELTIAQFGVLEALYHKGPLRICEIIEKTLSTSGNMTVVIKNLQKSKHIIKERDPEDGRAFIVNLTEKGHSIIAELFPEHLGALAEAFSNLEISEKYELLKLLKKLNGLV